MCKAKENGLIQKLNFVQTNMEFKKEDEHLILITILISKYQLLRQ